MKKRIWYKKPASVWEEGLPLGNGRIGAMVFSGAVNDKIQVNEDTLWSGYPNKSDYKHSIKEIEEIRRLVNEKKYHEATLKTSEIMPGLASEAYLNYGNIYVDIVTEKAEISDYERSLDFENAIVTTKFKLNSNPVVKETFVSLKDDIMVVNIKSKEKISVHAYQAVELEHKAYKENDNILMCEGRCPTVTTMYYNEIEYGEEESIRFCSCLKPLNKEQVCTSANSIMVDNQKDITLIFSIKTSFNGYDKMPVTQGRDCKKLCMDCIGTVSGMDYEKLKSRHINEYKKYFDRVELEIDGEDFGCLPTDERIANAGKGAVDNGLVVLLFDFGRYLTISSSMPGTQPSTLQGIWNDKMMPCWHSNYTMNINTQMNYWPTETCNLPECHMPFLEMLKDFAHKGNVFGLRGWSSWHNSDIWRFNVEATKGVLWGFWQMGGFWGVRHIWEHYLHTRDIKFLEEYCFVFEGAADFLEDWMYKDENGKFTTCPSTSPENVFIYNGEKCAVTKGSAMDMGIIYDVYDKTVKTYELLGKDASHYKELLDRLDTIKIGKDGRILEWGDEFEESEPGHRHISHLYYLFPSDVLYTGEYEDAARKTLRVRLENGGGHTGWSNAWIANVYARLKDGEKAMFHIRNMFRRSIYPNMLDAHPPFQIDGNFGICSAICEMLLQSHRGKTELAPAIPKEWKSGRVRGLISRNGEKVSFEWEDAKVVKASIV